MGGWFRINSDVIKEKGAKMGPYGMAVYMVLAMHADNETGETWPSYQTIAEEAGISRRKVISTIDHLLELGVIEKEARIKETGDATSNQYTIVDTPKGGSARHAPPSAPDAPSSAQNAPEVVHVVHRGSAPRAPELDLIELEKSVPADAGSPPPDNGEDKPLTPQQKYFGKICDIVGWNYKTLTDEQQGQVAQTVGILQKADYTQEDLERFGTEVWAKDWRWQKHKSHPTLSQLRAEIGKLKSDKGIFTASQPSRNGSGNRYGVKEL